MSCTRLYAADIVFLLDGSSSIGRSNFREVRGFLEGLVLPFSGAAGAQGVRFAAVQYSDDPRSVDAPQLDPPGALPQSEAESSKPLGQVLGNPGGPLLPPTKASF